MTTKKTFEKGNLTVELDREQVFPDDPGAGTPAMVYWRNGREEYSATYWCAIGEAELDGDRHGMKQLTDKQVEWLDDLNSEIDDFLYGEDNG